MARPDSALSLELERSMNMQVRVETFEEHLRHAGVIDDLDDERRIKSFNLNKWNEDMQKSFSKTRSKILKLKDLSSMKKALEDLDKKTLKALAKYFSERQWPALGYSTPDSDIAVARSAAVAGQCAQCHLGAWVGNSRVPRLAGQNMHYLEKTMLDFKYGRRKNAPDIASLFKSMEDEEIKSLARYGAGK